MLKKLKVERRRVPLKGNCNGRTDRKTDSKDGLKHTKYSMCLYVYLHGFIFFSKSQTL